MARARSSPPRTSRAAIGLPKSPPMPPFPTPARRMALSGRAGPGEAHSATGSRYRFPTAGYSRSARTSLAGRRCSPMRGSARASAKPRTKSPRSASRSRRCRACRSSGLRPPPTARRSSPGATSATDAAPARAWTRRLSFSPTATSRSDPTPWSAHTPVSSRSTGTATASPTTSTRSRASTTATTTARPPRRASPCSAKSASGSRTAGTSSPRPSPRNRSGRRSSRSAPTAWSSSSPARTSSCSRRGLNTTSMSSRGATMSSTTYSTMSLMRRIRSVRC